MAKKQNNSRISLSRVITLIGSAVAVLNSPEARRMMAAVSDQTKRWAKKIRNRRPDKGGRILSPLKPDHDASKLLFRLKALDAAATDLATVETGVSTEVRREVASLRAKVSAAHRLPKDVAKPKLKELALTIEQLETQIADALG